MISALSLSTRGPAAGAQAVVLVLHGGQAVSTTPDRRGLAWARMVPFAAGVRHPGVAVWLLRYRVRGWNGAAEDPVVDASRALAECRRRLPGAPIVLVGHSMGGRVALRLAAEPGVAGVCALAPWLEPGDPIRRTGARVLIAHGDDDRVTDPRRSAAYATAIGAEFLAVPHETHSLLHHPRLWQRLTTGFVTDVLAGRLSSVPQR